MCSKLRKDVCRQDREPEQPILEPEVSGREDYLGVGGRCKKYLADPESIRVLTTTLRAPSDMPCPFC